MDSSALYSDDYRKNPEKVWEEMRNDFPVFYDDISNMWWVTRYEDVKNIFVDYQTFSSSTYELSTGKVVGPTLISRDDYGHVVRRKIVAPDFVGNRLKAYEQLIEDCGSNLIDNIASTKTISLVSEFSS